jgi:hypothetical protein
MAALKTALRADDDLDDDFVNEYFDFVSQLLVPSLTPAISSPR